MGCLCAGGISLEALAPQLQLYEGVRQGGSKMSARSEHGVMAGTPFASQMWPCLMCAAFALQREAAGSAVPGHVRGSLGVHYSCAVHGLHGAAVCGAQRLGGAAAAAGASGVLDLCVLSAGLLCGHLGYTPLARQPGAALPHALCSTPGLFSSYCFWGHMLHACSLRLQRCDLACNGPACCSRSISLLQHLPQHCHQSAHDNGSLLFMQVAAFQCLQPFVGTMLAFAVLGEEPSVWDLGAIGIFIGLFLVVFDKKDSTASLSSNTGMRKVSSNFSLAQLLPFRMQQKLKSEKSGEKNFFSSIL